MLRRFWTNLSGKNCLPTSLYEVGQYLDLPVTWGDVKRVIPENQLVSNPRDIISHTCNLAGELGIGVQKVWLEERASSMVRVPQGITAETYTQEEGKIIEVAIPALIMMLKQKNQNELVAHAEVLDGASWRQVWVETMCREGWMIAAILEMIAREEERS